MRKEDSYTLSFKNVHRDIERHIEHAGKVEKRKDGSLVYRRYGAAQQRVIDDYLEAIP